MRRKMMKPFKRLLHDKRAISAVLSHLLLTVVAVALMAVATSATYVITTDLRQNMGERVAIEDVWFNSATKTVDLYLNNVGKVDIDVAAVYVNHASQQYPAFSLKVGEEGSLKVYFTGWDAGEVYYIDIVTSRGNHIAGDYKAT
jgi:FlaG/FlaF family flagellin (archaellin)